MAFGFSEELTQHDELTLANERSHRRRFCFPPDVGVGNARHESCSLAENPFLPLDRGTAGTGEIPGLVINAPGTYLVCTCTKTSPTTCGELVPSGVLTVAAGGPLPTVDRPLRGAYSEHLKPVSGVTFLMAVHGADLSAVARGEYATAVWRSFDDGDTWVDETGDLVTISPGPGVWYKEDFYFVTRGEGVTVKRNFEK